MVGVCGEFILGHDMDGAEIPGGFVFGMLKSDKERGAIGRCAVLVKLHSILNVSR